jgi:hypothetical protein
MTQQANDADRARQALSSSDAFCKLTAAARFRKFPGYWQGSAFRRHPCGVIAGAIKLTNHWHVDNSCAISITSGDAWTRPDNDSFGHGDPYPRPANGGEVTVWECGKWRSDEFRNALEPKVLDLLTRMAAHVTQAEAAEQEAEAQRREKAAVARRELKLAAISRATGESA